MGPKVMAATVEMPANNDGRIGISHLDARLDGLATEDPGAPG